jgi:hypothetical protein
MHIPLISSVAEIGGFTFSFRHYEPMGAAESIAPT